MVSYHTCFPTRPSTRGRDWAVGRWIVLASSANSCPLSSPQGLCCLSCHMAWCTSTTWTRHRSALWKDGWNLQADLGIETCLVTWGETPHQATGTCKKEWASLLSRQQQDKIKLLDADFWLLHLLSSPQTSSHWYKTREQQISLQVKRLQLIFLLNLQAKPSPVT